MIYRVVLALVIVGCSVDPASEHGRDGERNNFDRAAWWKRVTAQQLLGTTRDGQSVYSYGGPMCGRLEQCQRETGNQSRSADSVPRTCGSFKAVSGDMLKPRVEHAAIEARAGRVLVVGGYNLERQGKDDYWFLPSETAELRSIHETGWQVRDDLMPSGSWFKSNGLTMIKLHDGNILFAGGSFAIHQAVESYVLDPSVEEADWHWTRIGNISRPNEPIRLNYSISAWGPASERAVVAGGLYFQGVETLPYLDTRLLDSSHRQWIKGPDLIQPRIAHAAVTVQGRVILLGGASPEGLTANIEYLQYNATRWESLGELVRPRMNHQAIQLSPEEVLVVGGEVLHDESGEVVVTASTEIVNLETGTSVEAEPLPEALTEFGLSRLPSGHILVTGGDSGLEGADEFRARAYLYDVHQRRWLRIDGDMSSPRSAHTPVEVAGTVMLTGGVVGRYDDDENPIYTASSEVFSPGSCANYLPFIGRR